MERIALIITIFLVVSVLPLGIAGAVKADFYNDTSSNNITLTQYEHEAKSQPEVLMLLLDGQVSNPPQPPPAEPSLDPPDPILREDFADDKFHERGWFDSRAGTSIGVVDPEGKNGIKPGSTCLKWRWRQGEQYPDGTSWGRKNFDKPVEEMFVRAYMYFEEGWVGSGVAYHPHMFTFYPEDHVAADGGWPAGLGFLTTYLSVRSELTSPYRIRPFFALQDGRRVNTDYGTPPMDLTKTTEYRSVNHCNGCAAGQDCGTSRGCDNWGGGNFYSINYWRVSDFEIPKGEWVKCEWYVKMNTVDAVGKPDGILRMWVNDNLVYDSDRMLYRTAQNPNQTFKQVKITPYIGVGSPKDQTMWVDNFVVYDYNVKK